MDSSSNFEAAVQLMSSGVYIVTSAYRNMPAGCTCVWVTRVSFSPPLIAVNLEPAHHTLATIESGKRFCVNVLGDDALALARRFGFTSGHHEKKFTGVPYRKGASGSPVLEVAVAYLDCKLHSIVPAGDHRIVLGELIDAAVLSDKRPLIYDSDLFYKSMGGQTEGQAEHSSG
jgi:flavin reductase (DIM6/NTAB) family NADH-FMN oxidoreductase RutF